MASDVLGVLESGPMERGSAAARGYGHGWRLARESFLRKNPYCEMCKPKLVPATVVDHRVPHRQDQKLFWDRNNWQGLCFHCHDSNKQRLEKSGRVVGCDKDGLPIDLTHPWNQ